MWFGGAGADPDAVEPEQRLLDQHALDERQRERRDGARLEAGRAAHLVGTGDLRAGDAERAGDLRRVGATVARDEHDGGTAVGVEDERLDDPARLAADRLGRRLRGRRALLELLEARLGSRPRAGRPRRARPARASPRSSVNRSTRTAHALYSGVPVRGSTASIVSQFTSASAKWSAIQTSPG